MDDAMVEALHDSDDQLDALLCALLARAAELGRLQPIEDPAHAVTEGWIRLPVAGSLSQLVGE
jgi:hypothetical protein